MLEADLPRHTLVGYTPALRVTLLSITAIDVNMDRDILITGTVDVSLTGGRCFICYGDPFKLGDSVVKLRCACPYWTHEECLSRCIVEYTECPTCRISSPVDLGAMGLGVDLFTSISPSFFYYLNNHPSDDILT